MIELAFLATAGAAEITPEWSSEPVRYRAEAFIQHFHPIELMAIQNHNIRATTVMMAATLECSGEALKKGTMLTCSIDDIELQAEPQHADQLADLEAVMVDYDSLLTGAQVAMKLGKDGRIRSLELVGVERSDARMSDIQQTLQLLLRRLLAPLDQQQPSEGSVTTGDVWKHRTSPVVFELFRRQGAIGGSLLKYTVLADDGAELRIQAEGHGNIGLVGADPVGISAEVSPEEPEVQQGSAPGFEAGGAVELSIGASTGSVMYNVLALTRARYDISAAQWAYLDSTAQGQRNQGIAADSFVQSAWMGRLNDDGTIEGLGALED